MAAAGTGRFMGNVLAFVVTSALGYFCAAAAGLRLISRLTQKELEDGCDLWLHDCAASSTDGVFTRTKEEVCALAAPDICSPYLDAKRSRWSFLPGSNRLASRRQTPLALEGRASEETLASSGMSAIDKLEPHASLNVSPGWSFVGCNALAWTSVYIVCVAVHKARARRFRQAPRELNAAGGHRVETSASDTGRGRNMALGNATGVANISSNGGYVRGGRSSTRNMPEVEVPQQARIVSETLQPHNSNHSEDHNAAITDSKVKRKPGASSNVSPGLGSSADLRPYSALLPSSPLSPPLCDLSPSRCAMLSPQAPRFPMLEGISGAKRICSGDIGSTGQDISIRERNGRHSMPFAAVEGRAQQGRKAAGGRRTNSGFSPSALTVPYPDTASPPNLRGPNPARSSSVTQAHSNRPSPPSKHLPRGKTVLIADSIASSTKTVSSAGPRASPPHSPVGAKWTEEVKDSGKGGKQDTSSAPTAPLTSLAASSPAHLAPSLSETKLSGESSRQAFECTRDIAIGNGVSNRVGTRSSEAERALRHVIGLGAPNFSASANAQVTDSESSAIRSATPVYDTPGSEVSFSDGASSQVPACFASFLDAPSTTSTTSTTYSACWTVLGEGFTRSTSLHGVSDLESDVASSAGSDSALTPDTDGPTARNPAHMDMSSHDILEQPAAGWKEDIMRPRTNCAALSTASSVGQNARLPEFGAAQPSELDQCPAGFERTRGGVEDQKRTSTCKISWTEQRPELDVLAHPNRDRVGVEEPKGVCTRKLSSGCGKRAFDAHAGYDGIGGGAVENGEASFHEMPSALKGRELQANVRVERYACCAGEGKGPCVHEIAAENTE